MAGAAAMQRQAVREEREGKVCGEQVRLVTRTPTSAGNCWGKLGTGRRLRRAGTRGGATASQTVKTPRTPGSAARCNTRAGLKRRKLPGRWKTVEAERGWTVAPDIPKRTQQCASRSGLFSSGRRRGDLWKPQERKQAVTRKALFVAKTVASDSVTQSAGGS